MQAENIACQKLTGDECNGKVRGLGHGVSARDVRNLCYQVESPIVLKLLKKVHTLENQLDVLNAKVGAHASVTPHGLVSKYSTGSQEVSRHDTPCDHYSNQDSPVGNGSHKGSRHETPHDQYRSNDSPKSRDAILISNALENQTQRGARSSKQIDSVHDGQQKQSGKTTSLSKPSNVNNIFGSFTHGRESRNPLLPSSTLFNDGAVRPRAQPSKHTACNHDGGRSYVELTRKGGPTLGGNSIEGSSPSRHSQVENQKENLKVMGICKCSVEPNMLDSVLREKLDEIALVATKGNVQREGIRNE